MKKEKHKINGKAGGTCLKPSFEPIIVARKPFKGSLVDSVMEYGVGGINIDECRIGEDKIKTNGGRKIPISGDTRVGKSLGMYGESKPLNIIHNGRFPANVILTYDETDYDEVCGGFPVSDNSNGSITKRYDMNNQVYGDYGQCNLWESYGDSGSASRYFYCAKASKKDREEGLEYFEEKPRFQQGNYSQSPVCSVCGKTFNGTNDHSSCGENTMTYMSKEDNQVRKNIHPTVKPTELMQYLVRLVTPKGGIVLDPFMGSGSTGKAVMYENVERDANYKFIGIEMEKDYCDIAKARISYAKGDKIIRDINIDTGKIEERVERAKKQVSLF